MMKRLVVWLNNKEMKVLLTGTVLYYSRNDLKDFGFVLVDNVSDADLIIRGDGFSKKIITEAEQRRKVIMAGMTLVSAFHSNGVIRCLEKVLDAKDKVVFGYAQHDLKEVVAKTVPFQFNY